jgi:hypothetical protein
MWDVLRWSDGTLSLAWWAVLILALALISAGSAQHRK